jgi:hypothetical protein
MIEAYLGYACIALDTDRVQGRIPRQLFGKLDLTFFISDVIDIMSVYTRSSTIERTLRKRFGQIPEVSEDGDYDLGENI